MDGTACYKLVIGTIVPRAMGWASTLSADGVANLAPFSFFTAVSRKPPMVSLTIQPRSDRRRLKDTLVNVQATGEFVVNIVSLPQANAMHASSVEFEPEVDEFEAVGVSKAPSHLVKPSRVAGAPVSMAWRLERIRSLGGVGAYLVMGRGLRFHLAPSLAPGEHRRPTAPPEPVR